MLSTMFTLFAKWVKNTKGKEILVSETIESEISMKLLNGWSFKGVWEYYFQ